MCKRQPGAAPEHFEFLATDTSDPRPAFISALCDALGDRGSIVVYHQQFESQRLSELASWLPEFSERIDKIQSPTLGLATDHPQSRLPSGIWWLILAEIGAPGAGARDDIRRDGSGGRAGCRAGLGVADSRWLRARQRASRSGRRCWTTVGRTRWGWSGC